MNHLDSNAHKLEKNTDNNLHEPTSAEMNGELHKEIYRVEDHLNRLLDAGMAMQVIYGGIAILIIVFV